MYQTGLVSVSFRKNSPREILAACKQAGLSCVEWGSDAHAPCRDAKKQTEIAALGEACGIACCSYGTYFRLGVTPPDELADYCSAAKRLETDILRLWCSDKGSAAFDEMDKKALFAVCEKAAETAEAQGVTLCMECHGGTYTDRLESALELMRAIDSPRFRMYWQPDPLKTPDENLRYAEAIADYVKIIHVFHWRGDRRFPLAEGVGWWKRYLQAIGRETPLLLEFMPDDRIQSLQGEADALREIIS